MISISRIVPDSFAKAFWLDSPVLQEHFFRMALREAGIFYGRITVDHTNGMCWHKKIGWVPIIFPIKIIQTIARLSNTKTTKYFLRGVITDSRSWIRKYPNIHSSTYGRNRKPKYKLDLDYYQQLSLSFYGISPIGDCPWSYRFFEAIMCKAIPILGDNEDDRFAKSFFFLRDSSEHFYDKSAADSNFQIFVKNHTLAYYLPG
jgi:hypothetical protein